MGRIFIEMENFQDDFTTDGQNNVKYFTIVKIDENGTHK